MAAAVTRRRALGLVVSAVGVAGLLVSLLGDRPEGLDAGETAVAYAGTNAVLLDGFYAQVAACGVLIAAGLLVALYAGATGPRPGEEPPSRAPPPAAPAPAPAGRRGRHMSRLRAIRRAITLERLLPLAIIGGALILIGSEFTDTFRLEAPGDTTLGLEEASDRHSWAIARARALHPRRRDDCRVNGSKPAATATAVFGVAALLLFLLIDLPDAGKVGTFDSPNNPFVQTKAEPEGGFWLLLDRLARRRRLRDRAGDPLPRAAAVAAPWLTPGAAAPVRRGSRREGRQAPGPAVGPAPRRRPRTADNGRER